MWIAHLFGMKFVMPVPPVVTYRDIRGPAYLLAWQRRGHQMWAMLGWAEVDDRGRLIAARRAWVDAASVAKIQGQDYRAVPRLPPAAGPPRDETDPRDPGRMSRAEARQRIDSRRKRREEPNF